MRILAISGSTRSGSTNTAVVRTAAALSPDSVSVRVFDGLARLPLFNPDADRDPLPGAVVEIRAAIAGADALLLCTPEYAGALPGALKNLLEWTVGGVEISGKPVAWINVSGGPTRGADAHASLRKVLSYVGADLVERLCRHVPLPRSAIDAEGLVTDPEVRAAIRDTIRGLAEHVAPTGPTSGERAPGGVRLETADLVLRELGAADWEAVHAYAADPEVVRYELWGPNTEAQTRAFVDAAIRAREEDPRRTFELAVTLRSTGELIGGAGLRVRDATHREGDLGYALHPAFWRRGFGTQVARALVRFGFDELGLHRIWATCHSENTPSARVLANAGLQYEARLRAHRFQRGAWRDSLLFAILETDPRSAA